MNATIVPVERTTLVTENRLRALFAKARAAFVNSVFADKRLLDPSLAPPEILGRSVQTESLVRGLADVDRGYLPPLIEVYGPSGTGKTCVVREVVAEAAEQFPQLRAVYVNLKQCRSLFAVGNRILTEVTGSPAPPVSGLDGIFEALWTATRDRPFLLLILDEVDAAFQMARYDPSDFMYRLVRHRSPQDPPVVGLITITNRLMGLGSILDSRVKSSMGSYDVFFGPYDPQTLWAILAARAAAFRPGALKPEALSKCAILASENHGDARLALDLLRAAGEMADRLNEVEGNKENRKVEAYSVWNAQEKLDAERADLVLSTLPDHEAVIVEALSGILTLQEVPSYGRPPPVAREVVPAEELFQEYCHRCFAWSLQPKSRRRFFDFLDNLEMHGLVESRVESSGRHGRRRLVWPKENIGLIRAISLRVLRERHGSESDYERMWAAFTGKPLRPIAQETEPGEAAAVSASIDPSGLKGPLIGPDHASPPPSVSKPGLSETPSPPEPTPAQADKDPNTATRAEAPPQAGKNPDQKAVRAVSPRTTQDAEKAILEGRMRLDDPSLSEDERRRLAFAMMPKITKMVREARKKLSA